MMSNLFSIFDPSTNLFNISFNWISTILGIMFIPYSFWLIPNRHFLLWNFILLKLHNEFKTLLKNNYFQGSTFIFISMFSFILFNNFLGLFPYIFTSTSHLTLSLSISLPLWLSFMIYGWLNNSQHMFIHMIPQGTPTILMPFMVLIETISNIIRPGTLAVRLTANMIAGHLLMTLLSGTGPSMPSYFIMILVMIQILLLILESAVAVIQSYVIAILSTLYSSEVN
ncbi:ATP synthase F0 subunit 6 (mitochondrion) [Spodoptera frugiperda]|uniref:ATP synthase subunit a n=1 Tax=Spodoptera frugiperda TaxID=7108 RepID=A0A0K0LG47_SPOFR|nr:ATP synthase F0 subunit 6 [Spodoptera frugiperda]AJA05942.1 ATP synthase F0 subunit 6 [Spodoptera frugiperda]QGI24696.1 ATP synthase F0 subunit 6 [Spodoptera frugiperda]QHB74378.1 ATP synthase F0 subunit 6 [Spodoptera frugiperda]QHN56511.1 ATP synthase F0 subunit 6 [Spodoptera frugiperda]QHN56524.1 ATP synthase F0 subunit 6 [Spodoptera frugiperda]